MITGLFIQRVTGSVLAGFTGGMMAVFAGGTRSLLLMLPTSILQRLSANLTMLGSSAQSGENLAAGFPQAARYPELLVRTGLYLRIPALLLICAILAACSPDGKSPPASRNRSTEASPDSQNAVTAEEMVYSFITAYENNPDEMILYLSPELRENLPPGGVLELLGFRGTLEGLVFTSGASASDPHTAVVEAHALVDQKELIRVFTLARQDSSWVIVGIERVEQP